MPKLLDLFCGAGGASVGYARAGWEVYGVDIKSQPHYPFSFCQADALTFPLQGFDAIHASPPCQRYSRATFASGDPRDHPDLVDAVRERLIDSGIPYVIENVPEANLHGPVLMCGTMFGLPVVRHRHFEASFRLFQPPFPCRHTGAMHFTHRDDRGYREAMNVGWMTNKEGRQAIPPAYTQWVGSFMQLRLEKVA